jgi:hypothetical protein
MSTENLVVAEPTSLAAADELAKMTALAERLPALYKDDVILLKRPSPTDLANIVAKLPADAQEKVMEIVRKTRPKKQGVHSERNGFTPTDIKLFHGTGNDPMRPKNTIPGQFYTSESKIMEPPFDAVVIHAYEGMIMWPPKDAEGAGKGPICTSLDRQRGSKYGDCNTCPNKGKKWSEGGCLREVVAYVVDRDFTGIYVVRMSKTSEGAGQSIMRVLKKSNEIYERWFRFETQERTEGDRRWFVIKASPVSDPKNPKNETTDKQLHPLLNAFSRLIDADVYYPAMADVYTRNAASGETPAGAAGGEGLNEEELAGKGGAVDYSKPAKASDNI